MAKGERTINPAAAHLKSQKNRAIKKNRAAVQEQRTQRLASRNPERLQRQIDELKAVEAAQSGQLRPRDRQQLEQLERDVGAIRKARERTGNSAATDANPAQNSLGKRRRDDGDARGRGSGARRGPQRGRRPSDDDDDDEPDTDPDVRSIPMPRDTPPPVPPRRLRSRAGDGGGAGTGEPHALPVKPSGATSAPQTTYAAAPQLRNLQKEATAQFVPSAVAARIKQARGGAQGGRYLEPEEVDRLERAGYLAAKRAADEAGKEAAFVGMAAGAAAANGHGDDGSAEARAGTFEEQEAAFEQDLRDAERDAALEDARGAADAAQEEAELRIMAEDVRQGGGGGDAEPAAEQARSAKRNLRMVEIEEVEDAGD